MGPAPGVWPKAILMIHTHDLNAYSECTKEPSAGPAQQIFPEQGPSTHQNTVQS